MSTALLRWDCVHRMTTMRNTGNWCVLLLVLSLLGDSGGVEIIQPPPGGSYDWIADIPLWIRLSKAESECYEVFLDGQSVDTTCDEDLVLVGTVPAPGEHRIELLATFLPSSAGVIKSSTFVVTHNHPVPRHLSPDGITVELPDFIQEYHKWWYQQGIWAKSKWRDVVTHKQPMDAWNYQEVIQSIKPRVVVEFGTRFGGSTLFFSAVMKGVHGQASPYKIFSVDIDHSHINKQAFEEDNVELMMAPSASRRAQKRIEDLRGELGDGPIFVILDADHGKDNVTLELQMVAPVMKDGDYLVVEDSNLDGHDNAVFPGWGPCPYDAILDFMAMNRGLFQRDYNREYMFGFTQATAGFWRRLGGGESVVNPLPENPYYDE